MSKKLLRVSLVLTFVVMAALLAVNFVAAQEITREETVIFDIDGGRVETPELWNPWVPGSRRDHGFHQAVIEPLFILNYETGEFMPWLAQSMVANETLDSWTLTLRDGVEWSDGVAFSADDIVFNFETWLVPENAGIGCGAAMQSWVKGVSKVDDLTVQIDLNRPNPRFQLDYFSVRIWGGCNFVPKHIWEGQDVATFTNYDPAKGWPVFTGPYKVESVSNTEFSYIRNDNWWGAKTGVFKLPTPKRLIWTWAGPEEARAALMADNGLDSLMDITLGTFLALKEANPNVIAWLPDLPYVTLDPCPRGLEFNTAVEPWSNKNLRWAVNYAIDRNEIIRIAYEGTSVPSRAPFPAYAPLNRYVDLLEAEGVFERHPLWTHDPAKAEEMIQAEGYAKGADGYYAKDGVQLSFDITTHEAFIEKQRIAAVIVEQLQDVGINASTRNEAGGTWDENWRNGSFEGRMGWHTCGSVNEPWATMDNLNASWLVPIGERANSNPWRWNNARYSELVDQIGVLPLGDPAIDPLFVEAMELYYSELPTIPVSQARKLIPFNTTYWTNWPTAENNYISSWTWWQSTHAILQQIQPAES